MVISIALLKKERKVAMFTREVDLGKIKNVSIWEYEELRGIVNTSSGNLFLLMEEDGGLSRFKGSFLRRDIKRGFPLKNGNKILVRHFCDVIVANNSLLLFPETKDFGFFADVLADSTQKKCDYMSFRSASVRSFTVIDLEELTLTDVRIFPTSMPNPEDFDFLRDPKSFLVVDGKSQKLVRNGETIDLSQVPAKIKISPMAEKLILSGLLTH